MPTGCSSTSRAEELVFALRAHRTQVNELLRGEAHGGLVDPVKTNPPLKTKLFFNQNALLHSSPHLHCTSLDSGEHLRVV
jgi:hypothetical protein